MSLGAILDRIRTYYLDRLSAEVAAQSAEPSCTVVTEGCYVTCTDAVAAEGTLGLPLRGDIFVVREGAVVGAIQVDTEQMLSFQPIEFVWEGRLAVRLEPFQWNCCACAVSGAGANPPMAFLRSWFLRWFAPRQQQDGPFLEVVHFLSDPAVNSSGLSFVVDFGSAPVDALEELFDAVMEMGGTNLQLGQGG